MRNGPSTNSILSGAEFTPALTSDEVEKMLKHDPRIRSRSILRQQSEEPADERPPYRKTISFEGDGYSFSESSEEEESDTEEIREAEERERQEREAEEKKLYDAKIKFLSPLMLEHELSDAFLKWALDKDCDFDEFKVKIKKELKEIRDGEAEVDGSEISESKEESSPYMKRCRDINECIRQGIVVDDGFYRMATDKRVSDAFWEHRIKVLMKKREFMVSGKLEVEEYMGANPKEQGTHIAIDENYTEDKRRYTDRIVDEHACELVEKKSFVSKRAKENGQDMTIRIYTLREANADTLKEQIQDLSLENADAAREKLNEIILSAQMLSKNLNKNENSPRLERFEESEKSKNYRAGENKKTEILSELISTT